jgi:hypothetical protein
MKSPFIKVKGNGWCLNLKCHKEALGFAAEYYGTVIIGGNQVPVFRSEGSGNIYLMYRLDEIKIYR